MNLNSNGLTDLPDSLQQLNQLETLDPSHNQLSQLNFSLGESAALRTLALRGNPIPPDQIGVFGKRFPQIELVLKFLYR